MVGVAGEDGIESPHVEGGWQFIDLENQMIVS